MSLHHEAVSEELRNVLKKLMRISELDAFYLVGGTSLALRFGHRVSVDIDLFTHEPFDALALHSKLVEQLDLSESAYAENTISGLIRGIKIDCIAHRYPLLRGVEEIEGIRLLAVEDVAAMKLNAIANRGSKKDFYDVFELLQHFELSRILGFYEKKYPQGSVWNVEKSLSYFEDAEAEPDSLDLRGRSWTQIKEGILKANRLR